MVRYLSGDEERSTSIKHVPICHASAGSLLSKINLLMFRMSLMVRDLSGDEEYDRHQLSRSRFVMPAQAGIQGKWLYVWMPACAGMTDWVAFNLSWTAVSAS